METRHRLNVLLRGLGVLILIMALVAAVGVLSRGTPHAAGATPTPTPQPTSPTDTPSPPAAATDTPAPPAATATPSLPSLVAMRTSAAHDPATGVSVSVRSLHLTGARRAAELLVLVQLHDGGRKAAPYSATDFFAVNSAGATMQGRPSPIRPSLGSSTLGRGRTATGWVAFRLPTAGAYVVIWNDGSNLIPPAQIATLSIR